MARAIANLRRARVLAPAALAALPTRRLARLIRSTGYYRTKAPRVKVFLRFLRTRYGFNLSRMLAQRISILRQELLALSGIEPETADSIFLYAGHVPTIVVDAYTRRILARHGLIDPDAISDAAQALFMQNLFPDVRLYNESHALLVAIGKDSCRAVPRCAGCPLRRDPERHRPVHARRFLGLFP